MKRHGGKRPGAGRRRLNRVRKVVTLSPDSLVILQARTRRKRTCGQVIDRALALLKVTPTEAVDRALLVAEMA